MKRKRGSSRRKPTKKANVVGSDKGIDNITASNAANDPVDTGMELDIAQANATTSRGPIAGLNNDNSIEKTSRGNSLRENNVFKDVSSNSNPCIDARPVHDEIINTGEQMSSHHDPLDNKKELNAALNVIKTIMKMDAAKPFNSPVDPVALGIPDYFDIFDTPMDFDTICNNIDLGLEYRNSKDIYSDVELIWDNWSKYNKKGTKVMMKQVKTEFLKLWSEKGLYIQRQEPSKGHLHFTPAGESSDESQTDQDEPDSPLTDDCAKCMPVEDGHLSHPDFKESTVLEKKTRVRGPTRCLKLLFQGKRTAIATNELGQPVGVDARKLISFLGTLARDGHKAPLNYIEWRAMPEVHKENMWKEVQEKFIIDSKSKYWIMKSLSAKWKNWKARLKSERYLTRATNEERLANLDDRVLPDQWEYLVSHWNSEKAKRRSAINKACSANLVFRHAIGSKSVARLREEQKQKSPYKKPPSRAELFILTRIRKDGKPVNEATSAIIEKLRRNQDTAQTSTIEDEAFAQLVGRRKNGQVRCVELDDSSPSDLVSRRHSQDLANQCVELDPSPSDLVSRKHSEDLANQLALETKAAVLEIKNKMGTMAETCAQMSAQMTAMMAMMSSIQKNLADRNAIGPVHNTSEELPLTLVGSTPAVTRSSKKRLC